MKVQPTGKTFRILWRGINDAREKEHIREEKGTNRTRAR